VRNPDPGQNKKPHVVGQEFEICFPCSCIPADKVIPGGTLPGCRAKQKAGQGIVLPVKNQILHVLSHHAIETQIMIPGKQTLEEPQKRYIFSQLDMYRFESAQGAGNRSSPGIALGKVGCDSSMNWLRSAGELIRYHPLLFSALEQSLSHP